MISPITNGELGSSVRAKINTAFDMLNEIPAPIAVGDILLGAGIDSNGINTWTPLVGVATGNVLLSGGVGVNPSYGKVGLTTHVSGILPVANGGSGTSTAFTTGSILFAGASGVYSQDNAGLLWDNTNKRLGVNWAVPLNALAIGSDSAGRLGILLHDTTLTMPSYSTIFTDFPSAAVQPMAMAGRAGTGSGGMQFAGFTASGVTNGFPLIFTGYHGSSGTITTPGCVFRAAKHNGTTSAQAMAATEIAFEWRNWTTTLMTVKGNGNVGFGITPSVKFHAAANVGSIPSLGSQVGLFQNNSSTSDNCIFAVLSGTAGIAGIQLGDTDAINRATLYYHNDVERVSISGPTGNLNILGTNVGLTGITSPTAKLHLPAGAAAASSAPLKFTSGTNLTTAEAGGMEYNGTNLFFTRAGTTRENVVCASAVTTEVIVSDTSVTVNINGTTYKLLARA